MSSDNLAQLEFASESLPHFDVRRFRVHEQISAPWTIDVFAVCSDHDVDLDQVVDRGIAFILDRPEMTKERVWTGICIEIAHDSAAPDEEGLSTYRLRIVPELWRLSIGQKSRIFQHSTAIDIVLRVLKDWGFEEGKNVVVRNVEKGDEARYPKREYCVQYEESDLAFVTRLLEDSGVSFYFEYANDTSGQAGSKGRELTRIVIDGEPQLASDSSQSGSSGGGDKAGKAALGPYPYLGHRQKVRELGLEDVIVNAGITRVVRPGSVVVHDHDFRRALGERVAHVAPKPSGEKQDDRKYEQFQYEPGRLAAEKDPERGMEWPADRHGTHALNELLAQRAFRTMTRFMTNVLEIVPGSVVQFGEAAGTGVDHPRDQLSDSKHLVVETITEGATTGWRTACFSVSPDEPFRPARVTPRPRIHGMQSAIVVGPQSSDQEQIHTDKYGRIRVQFHWDRQHEYGDPLSGDVAQNLEALGSCWVRVVTPFAGSGYGMVAIPRVGHEVLVSFLDGNPDYPVVVRSLYNGANAPPFPLPADATRSGIRSNSTTGGNGYNEIAFEDRKGGELISIQAQKSMSTVVKGAESHSVGAQRTQTTGTVDTLHVKQEWRLVVGQEEVGISVVEGKEITIHVGGANGSEVKLSDNHIAINAKGEIHLHTQGAMDFSSVANIGIDAANNVFINDPDRQPSVAQCDPYVKARPPAPGAAIPPGTKGAGGGEMPEKVGPLQADVTFGEASSTDRG